MNRRLFLSTAAIAIVGAGAATLYAGRKSAPADAAPGAAASGAAAASGTPDLYALSLPDVGGQTQALAQWRGKPMVVNFWATWCAPCVREMPELDALGKKYAGVQFVGIGVDSADNIRKFQEKVSVSYPLLVMGMGAIDTLRQLGNPAGGLPFTLVFKADGSISEKILGEIDPAKLDASLAQLVA
ncbi:MAG: TlpA disulfide reductase family protein [Bordetella sp.]|nr:TlpA disulfide reductase family protein [Bordetella sp.]